MVSTYDGHDPVHATRMTSLDFLLSSLCPLAAVFLQGIIDRQSLPRAQ